MTNRQTLSRVHKTQLRKLKTRRKQYLVVMAVVLNFLKCLFKNKIMVGKRYLIWSKKNAILSILAMTKKKLLIAPTSLMWTPTTTTTTSTMRMTMWSRCYPFISMGTGVGSNQKIFVTFCGSTKRSLKT